MWRMEGRPHGLSLLLWLLVMVLAWQAVDGSAFRDARTSTHPYRDEDVLTADAVLVTAEAREHVASLCDAVGVELVAVIGTVTYRVRSRTARALARALRRSGEHEGVLALLPNALQVEVPVPHAVMPMDPAYAAQWPLHNNGSFPTAPFCHPLAGHDVNAPDAWAAGWTGRGIVVGIVDTGIQPQHADLAQLDALRLGAPPAVPEGKPGMPLFSHGTAVAGVAAAVANNGVCGVGVAHAASLVSLRYDALEAPCDMPYNLACWFARLAAHRNDRIYVKNYSFGFGGCAVAGCPLSDPTWGAALRAELEAAVRSGRRGLGTVAVWSAGNDGAYGGDVNMSGLTNHPWCTVVGSTSAEGVLAGDSNVGSAVLLVAPGGYSTVVVATGAQTCPSITSTTWNSSCADVGWGSSFAAPLVSGASAVLLEAQPALRRRDVEEIMLRTARPVAVADPSWARNGRGWLVSRRYGFGLLDVGAAVTFATTRWPLPIGAPLEVVARSTGGTGAIGARLSGTFTIGAQQRLRVERVMVYVTLTHGRIGDLRFTVTSPAGTVSDLLIPSSCTSTAMVAWRLTTVAMWGEGASGTWTFTIADETADTVTGSVFEWYAVLNGAQPVAPLVVANANVSVEQNSVRNSLECASLATDSAGSTAEVAYARIDPQFAPLFGSVVMDPVTRRCEYTPFAGVLGLDSFKFIVCTYGDACTSSSVTISILAATAASSTAPTTQTTTASPATTTPPPTITTTTTTTPPTTTSTTRTTTPTTTPTTTTTMTTTRAPTSTTIATTSTTRAAITTTTTTTTRPTTTTATSTTSTTTSITTRPTATSTSTTATSTTTTTPTTTSTTATSSTTTTATTSTTSSTALPSSSSAALAPTLSTAPAAAPQQAGELAAQEPVARIMLSVVLPIALLCAMAIALAAFVLVWRWRRQHQRRVVSDVAADWDWTIASTAGASESDWDWTVQPAAAASAVVAEQRHTAPNPFFIQSEH